MSGDEIPCWSNEAKSWWASYIRKLIWENELTEQMILQEISLYRDICRFIGIWLFKTVVSSKEHFCFLSERKKKVNVFFPVNSSFRIPTLWKYLIACPVLHENFQPGSGRGQFCKPIILYYRIYIIPYHIVHNIVYHIILHYNIAFSVLGEKFQPGSGPGQFCKPTSTQVQYIDCQMDIEKMLSFKDKHLQIIFPGFLNWYRLHCWWVNITPKTSTY